MAVDSHEDNHYELAIDNVNNNNNSAKKNLHQTSIKLESRDEDYSLDPIDDDDDSAADLCNSDSSQKGSARRKYSSVSKGISIEEFLLRQDRQGHLSAIDKLIIKNKTALQSLQMKQTRSKVTPAAATPTTAAGAATTNGKPKKELKPRKEKVLGSKIAVARKKVAATGTTTTETKNTTKTTVATKKVKNAAPPKVEETSKIKGKSKRTSQECKKVQKKEPITVPVPAAVPIVGKKRKTDADGKQIVKIKKKTNKTEKLIDLRGFKPNVSHKTRSFTKVVKLRNGKSRIIPETKKTPPPSPQPRRYNRRSASNAGLDNSSTSEPLVNGGKPSPAPFKRSIKQEPIDDDVDIKRKRRKTTDKVDVPSTPAVVANDLKPVPDAKLESTPIPAEVPTSVTEPAKVSTSVTEPAKVSTSVTEPAKAPNLVKESAKPLVPEEKPAVEETPVISKEIPAVEETPVISKEEIPAVEEKPVISKDVPAVEEAPILSKETSVVEETMVIDEDLTSSSSTEMIETPIVIDDDSSTQSTIEEIDPPTLSPQVPASVTDIDDIIVIDSSSDEPEIQEIEPPPVIPRAAPAPADDPIPAKLDDQLEDTATETSEDTECDEEFSLQDANTESEDIIDEDITLQYEIDDEDSTDKDIANEPTPAAVATAADLVPEPKEPVESAREKVAPIAEEPKVVPSQEKPPKQTDTKVYEKPENKAVKESILGALGLTSLEKVQQKVKENNNYTGTLKAVIKIDKGCRRMELKPKETGTNVEGLQNENVLSFYSKTLPNNVPDSGNSMLDKAKGDSEMHIVNGLDSSLYKNKIHDDGLLSSLREVNARSMETDYNGMIDPVSGLLAKEKTKAAASLVVPEKSSSFSIHPNRLCSDVCKYCFGKFGSLDTPCHVGQMKNPERQRKILLCEPNLKLDTCLCDACYRFVDRKANKPPQKRNKNNMRRSISINQRSLGPCVIQNCTQFARHTVKRKWLLRISKKIAKLSFDVNKGGPRMRYGLCSQHYYLMDFYTLCGICKKRLNRNHMYSIRSELNDLNNILAEDSIPIKLVDNMLLCKLCHYYMSLRLKYGCSSKMSPSNRQYYHNFRKKVCSYYNVIVSDGEDTITAECLKYENGDCIDSHSPDRRSQGSKMIEELAASSSSSKVPVVTTTITTTPATSSGEKRSSSGSSSSSSSSSKKNHNVGFRDIADLLKPLEGDGDKNSSTRIQVKFGNLNIGKLSNLNIGQNSSAHQNEPKHDKSGDKESVPLIADFCFKPPVDGQKNWEKCVSTILFDKGTKKLWQDLQKPYGNQSSFIRHLIMLEKYWRSGSMVLAETADPGAVKYITSVQNRIQSLETSSSPSPSPTPSSTPAPVPVSVAKAIPMPTLKPATTSAMENNTTSVHYVGNGSMKTSSSEAGSSSTTIRHTPAPPPLLKIDQMNGIPFGVSNKNPPSSESKMQYHSHVPKSRTPRNADISLEQYVEMMHPQPRTKNLTHVTNGSVKGLGVSLLKKTLPTMPTMKPIHIANSASAETVATSSASRIAKKSASIAYHGNTTATKPRDKQYYGLPQLTAISTVPTSVSKTVVNSSSMIIAKLPKALTVTQIDEPMSKDRMTSGDKPPLIPAPFLAGEKPSVSVFREITK